MRCPFCHDDNDKVIDSRSTDTGNTIRRRRHCQACDKRFTTYEHIERHARITVIKKDDSRVPYDRQKIIAGLEKACYKRTISAQQLEQIADEVEEQLFTSAQREVPSLDIGHRVSSHLKRIDHVAYLRFASVYMHLRNIDDLLEEVQEIKQQTPDPPLRDQGQLF